MRELAVKKLVKGLFYGGAMFVGALIFIDICFDASLSVLPHQYSRLAAGALFIGAGVVGSSMVYEEDRIPFVLRGLIQLVISTVVLLIGLFISGGIPDGTGMGMGLFFFLVEIVFGILIWLGYFICFLVEARSMKRKLQERNLKRNNEMHD